MAEREVGDEEFLGIARSPERARSLRKSLQKLAGDGESPGAGGALQEMAREVLAGRVGLREAMQVPAYREALSERTSRGFRAVGEMSEAERREAEAEGQRRLDEFQREIDEEKRKRHGGPPHAPGRRAGGDWPL